MSDGAPILIVVVLYRTAFDASKTLTGLMQAMQQDPTLLRTFDLLVWDNSPQPPPNATLPIAFRYHHAAQNEGVAGAYNTAARLAAEQGAPWLLLLDHDTSVAGDFLRGMRRHAEEVGRDEGIAAIAPFLYAGTFVVSPRLWRFARHVALPRPAGAYTEQRLLFAANSGTLMRVSALEAIGGYSPRFWLDYSDIYVFHRFHEHGFGVRIASDLAVEHEVAMLDYDARMSPGRYATYLAAESDFLDLHRGWAERLVHLLRLGARAVRQRRFADAIFSRMTRQELCRRLRIRRRARLHAHNLT
ncbi:MAG TPA: glycosyltransferase [Acidobacteriaceae bacterium]